MAEPKNAGMATIVIPLVVLVGLAVLAIIRPSAVIEVSLADFIVITVLLGGWAGWMSGRSIAATWRPYAQVVLYMIPFALVVRWVHFALFKGTLLSVPYYLVDLAVVLALATLGYRSVRAKQMTTQYRWLYRRTGPLSWGRSAEPS